MPAKRVKKIKASAEDIAWKLQCERWDKTKAIREEFQAIETKCNDLFRLGNHIRHEGHQDAWLLCASALDNAGDTATERGWDCDGLEYWECALGSLQCLCSDTKPRVARWFRKIGLKF
jgi:hypothetical protein